MSTSGTVSTTRINVQKMIDHGARRCGKLASELTSEQVVSAKESLGFLLSNLANRGIQYWAIDRWIIGLNPGKRVYYLDNGTVDVLNALYRSLTRPTPGDDGSYSSSTGTAENAFDSDVETVTVQTAPNGNIAVDFGTDNEQEISAVGILPGVGGSFNVVLEYSDDGSTWTTFVEPGAVTWVDDEWVWYEPDDIPTARYYRLRETGGGTMQVRELFLGCIETEIPMSRLNRDDYTSLPNKSFESNQPLQYWFDRTIPAPSMYVWPVPNDAFRQMVVWTHRYIEDVGTVQNELEIPQRWYEAIQFQLAHRMALELPNVPMERVQYLETQAEKYLFQAELEERDKSPIYLAPDISPYTR